MIFRFIHDISINGRDKSGPYPTGNELPYHVQDVFVLLGACPHHQRKNNGKDPMQIADLSAEDVGAQFIAPVWYV